MGLDEKKSREYLMSLSEEEFRWTTAHDIVMLVRDLKREQRNTRKLVGVILILTFLLVVVSYTK